MIACLYHGQSLFSEFPLEGTSLVVQGLGLHPSTTGGIDWSLVGELLPHMPWAWPKNKWKFFKWMPKKHPWWAENQNFKKKFACKWAEIVAQILSFVTDVKCRFSVWLNFLHQHDFVKQNYSLWNSRLQSGTSVSSWVFLSSQIVLHIYGQ